MKLLLNLFFVFTTINLIGQSDLYSGFLYNDGKNCYIESKAIEYPTSDNKHVGLKLYNFLGEYYISIFTNTSANILKGHKMPKKSQFDINFSNGDVFSFNEEHPVLPELLPATKYKAYYLIGGTYAVNEDFIKNIKEEVITSIDFYCDDKMRKAKINDKHQQKISKALNAVIQYREGTKTLKVKAKKKPPVLPKYGSVIDNIEVRDAINNAVEEALGGKLKVGNDFVYKFILRKNKKLKHLIIGNTGAELTKDQNDKVKKAVNNIIQKFSPAYDEKGKPQDIIFTSAQGFKIFDVPKLDLSGNLSSIGKAIEALDKL